MGLNVKYKRLSVLIDHLSADLITTVQQFEAIKDEWKNLFASNREQHSIFQDFTWNYTCWKYTGRNYKLAIITVREEGKLVGVGPFMTASSLGVSRVEPIGSGKFAYFGLLVSNNREDVIEAMAVKLVEAFPKGIYHFPYYASGNCSINVLAATLWSMDWHEARWVRNVSPYVYEESGFSDYFSRKSQKVRYNLRREYKNMEKIGNVVISHFAHSDLTDSIVERIDKIQKLSWLMRRGIETVDSPFNREVIPLLALEGSAEVFILSINENDAAFILDFCSAKCCHCMTIGFDERLKQVSPGKHLMQFCIQHVLDRGDWVYDFLFGGGGYKDFWGTRTKQVFRCVFYKGFRGWALSCFPRLHGKLAKYTVLKEILSSIVGFAGEYPLLKKILWKVGIIRHGNKPI